LFFKSSHKSLYVRKDLRTSESAKRHGYLLLDFHTADDLLCQVIGKGCPLLKGMCQYRLSMLNQAVEKISVFCVIGLPLPLGTGAGSRSVA
jgi:hypothetical protein